MAKDLNRCEFIGRLAKDIEVRYTPDGKAVANGSVAVNGYKKEQVEWVRFVAFDKLAEIMAKFLDKGSQIFLSGRLQTRSWEKDGITRYTTEIVASDVQFLGGGRSEGRGESSGGYPDPPSQSEPQEDDIPFA